MEQLLDIKNVPISFELKIINAKLEVSSDTTMQQGIVEPDYLTPYKSKLNTDTRVTANRIKVKTTKNTIHNSKKNNILEAMNTTTNIAKEGNLLMNTQEDASSLGILAFQHFQPTLQSTIGIPTYPTNFDWDSQQISVQYETDKKNYDWITKNKPKLKFTPSRVEFLVKEYAHVEFKYIGKQHYFPPSSDPDYEPPAENPDYEPPKLDVTA